MAENRKDFRIAASMQQVLKEKCFLDVGILGTIPFDKLARKAARSFTPIIVEHPRSQPSKAIHQMLAAILLDREQGSSRAELLHKTGQIRGEAKDRIRAAIAREFDEGPAMPDLAFRILRRMMNVG